MTAQPPRRAFVEVSDDAHGTTHTVTAHGEIDYDSAGLIARPLVQALAHGFDTVVLDLSNTTFIDSTGVGVVLGATRHAHTHATRFVVRPGPAVVQQAFELSGITAYVPFADVGESSTRARRDGPS